MSEFGKALHDLMATKEFDRLFTEITNIFREYESRQKKTDGIIGYEARRKSDNLVMCSGTTLDYVQKFVCEEYGVKDIADAPVYMVELHDYYKENAREPIVEKVESKAEGVRTRRLKMDFVEMASDEEIMEIDPEVVEYDDNGEEFDDCPLHNGKGRGVECGYTGKDCDNYGHMGSLPCEKCNEYRTEQLREKIKERQNKIKQEKINSQVI